jgi:hypothetical protein
MQSSEEPIGKINIESTFIDYSSSSNSEERNQSVDEYTQESAQDAQRRYEQKLAAAIQRRVANTKKSYVNHDLELIDDQ